jgi:plastocyanin
MRRPLLVLLLLPLALMAAACASTPAAWTYAPPTEAPPSQAPASEAPSAAPTSVSTPAPSEGAASESPGGGGGGGGTVVQVSALNIAFEQSKISAPADEAFTIHFDNKDASTPHDIAIKDASGNQVFKGDVITGPAQTDYQVPALPAGTYQFVCTIHPSMVGTLTVGG